jgi:hypothetical protein
MSNLTTNEKAHTAGNGMDFNIQNSEPLAIQTASNNLTHTLDNRNKNVNTSVLAEILNRPKNQKFKGKKQFNPNKLPKPQAFYARFSIAIKVAGWNMAKCPFHDDKHASLSVNGSHGGYVCHACGAKGSLIGFYMQMTNSDFKTAMTDLGAYDE